MKHYTAGYIFCKCSTRMHCKGKLIKIHEYTPKRKKCPNCGKLCKLYVKKSKNKLK